MKAKIQLYRNDGATDGRFPVKLILSHNRKTRRKTIAYANEQDWNEDRNFPRPSHPDYENVYDKVSEINKKAEKEEFFYISDFNRAFDLLLTTAKRTTNFYEWAETRIEQMRTPNKKGATREGNARAYETAVSELKSFRPYLSFSDITKSLLEQFKERKRYEGASPATIKNYISELRAIYNAAVRIDLTPDRRPFEGIFHDVRVIKRRAANSYFSKDAIQKLKDVDRNILTPAENRTLDLSLLQFYLGGQSLADIYNLKWEYIHKDRVYFPTRIKLGNRGAPYDVKIFPCAWEIIDRYKTEDGPYVFPWSKDYDRYKSFRENMNKRYLVNIQRKHSIELEPKGGHITTKVMRHTFATLGKFERIEEDLLRELMGHERNDIDTVYKDKYPEAERDAAQLRIIS